jgi:hypothetical protein
MKKLILFILILFSINFTFAQKFEGTFVGKFHQEETVINIDLENEVYNILFLTSSGKSFIAESKLENGKLNFHISMEENRANEYSLSKSDSGINIKYASGSEKFIDHFVDINYGKQMQNENDNTIIDSTLTGKWIRLGTYDSSGKIFESGTEKKNYYRTFTEDGRLIEDPRYFRDNAEKNGFEFSYTDIPSFFWKIKSLNILITSSPGQGSFEEEYYTQNDSLILKTTAGFKTYFVRDKKY